MIQKSISLKYEPASEPLHISVKYLAVGDGADGAPHETALEAMGVVHAREVEVVPRTPARGIQGYLAHKKHACDFTRHVVGNVCLRGWGLHATRLSRNWICIKLLAHLHFSSSLLLSSLELSDTKVYEPYIRRALLGTTAHFCKVVVLNLHAGQGHHGSVTSLEREREGGREKERWRQRE